MNPPARTNVPTRTQSLIEETKEEFKLLEQQLEPRGAYGMSSSIPPPRRNNLQNGAYRMVFSDKKKISDHHTRLNLRDRSCEPNNLFGDANVEQ